MQIQYNANLTQRLSVTTVKWLGYSHEHYTWEPVSNLTHCAELIQEYRVARRAGADERAPGERRRGKRQGFIGFRV
jgi:hypothetical protein